MMTIRQLIERDRTGLNSRNIEIRRNNITLIKLSIDEVGCIKDEILDKRIDNWFIYIGGGNTNATIVVDYRENDEKLSNLNHGFERSVNHVFREGYEAAVQDIDGILGKSMEQLLKAMNDSEENEKVHAEMAAARALDYAIKGKIRDDLKRM